MISVALCTYNGEKHLYKQLESVFNQSYPISELVICDDCSHDDTVALIESFKQNWPSIIKLYINETSLGPIKNFEKAIGLCSGDIIFLSDQDDIWKPQKVFSVINNFNSNSKLEMVFTNAELIDDKDEFIGKSLWEVLNFDTEIQKKWSTQEALVELLYKRNVITGATVAFKKQVYERAYPFTSLPGYWHDLWLGIHAAANKGLGFINESLIYYRIHPQQQVGIGNGVTTMYKGDKIPLSQRLVNEKNHYSSILDLTKSLQNNGYTLNSGIIIEEALTNLSFVKFRQTLPRNILLRVIKVLQSHKIYQNRINLQIRTMLRDMINPVN